MNSPALEATSTLTWPGGEIGDIVTLVILEVLVALTVTVFVVPR